MMTVLIQHDFLFVVTYQSVINCLIVHTITVSCFQSVKIILSTCHYHCLKVKSYSEACSELNHVSDFFTAQGESNLADELCKTDYFKSSVVVCQKRLANAVQKNITDFFNAK